MNAHRRRALLVVPWLAAVACGPRAEPARGDTAAAGSAAHAPAAAPAVTVRRDNPCSVLLPQEVESILGVPVIMREVVDEVTCRFPFEVPSDKPASGSAARPGEAQETGDAREARAIAKSLASAYAGGQPQLVVKVYFKDADTTLAATRMANSLMGGFEALPDIGDEAWLGPMASTLVFRKGDVAVELDLRMVPDARDKGIRLAKLIASRL